MARVSVEVPAELVSRLRETVLLLYEATAESLHLALRARSARRGSPRELHEHRVRLAQLDDLLAQLGGPVGPRLLSSPADLLHDAFYGALIDAGERLAVMASSSWRGEEPLERVQEAAAEVIALHGLLRHSEARTPGPDESGMASGTPRSQTKTATDHEEIRRWVEEHGGRPARVRGTREGSDDPGVLRIDFPGDAVEDQPEHISWDDWFEQFDGAGLAFLYEEQTASGEDSAFFKLVRRDSG